MSIPYREMIEVLRDMRDVHGQRPLLAFTLEEWLCVYEEAVEVANKRAKEEADLHFQTLINAYPPSQLGGQGSMANAAMANAAVNQAGPISKLETLEEIKYEASPWLKLFVILTLLLGGLAFLAGCAPGATGPHVLKAVGRHTYIDCETGVYYFKSGSTGSYMPRYQPDGSLYMSWDLEECHGTQQAE